MKQESPQKESLLDLFKSVLFAFILAISFRSFLYEPFRIPSGSMIPTLIDGDYIFVSKYSYGYSRYSFPFGPNIMEGRKFFSDPKRGDVIVFKLPSNTSINYIKRLIGLPGDQIQVKAGTLYINDIAVERKLVKSSVDKHGHSIDELIEYLPNGVSYHILKNKEGGQLDDTPIFTVPEGHYFMMGDNRDNSIDSRVMERVGFVPVENLVGRAEIIFFSSNSPIWAVWSWVYDLNIERFLNILRPKLEENIIATHG